jgi:endonuclease YncB( thermonuclease family)
MMGTPPLPLFYYLGTVQRWIDADSVDILVDLGFGDYSKRTFRLIGSAHPVDAYELHDRDPAKRLLAQQGHARSRELAPEGSVVGIRSVKGPRTDGFRRWLAEILTNDGLSVGDVLLSEGLAVIWLDR